MTGKKVASSVLIHHVKVRKRERKKRLFRSIIDYLKSNVYMFAPLVSSQSSGFYSTVTASTSCSGVDASEPICTKNEFSLENVKDYMMSDQYLYAPFFTHQFLFDYAIGTSSSRDTGPTSGSGKTDTNKWNEQMKKLTEEIKDPGKRKKSTRIEELRLGTYPYDKATIVRHVQLQKETVRHVVQQNCHS